MRNLKANAKVLGLRVNETFDSDDEFYDPFIEKGFLSVVNNEEDSITEDEVDLDEVGGAGEPVETPEDAEPTPAPAEESKPSKKVAAPRKTAAKKAAKGT